MIKRFAACVFWTAARLVSVAVFSCAGSSAAAADQAKEASYAADLARCRAERTAADAGREVYDACAARADARAGLDGGR